MRYSICVLTILIQLACGVAYGESSPSCVKEVASEKNERTSPRKIAVFVHGFIGDEDSWPQFPKLLKEDPELRGTAVCVVSYPTGLIGSQPSIKRIGEWLISDVVQRFKEYDAVYLIGHSMGGLVIQSGIVERLRIGKAEELKNIRHVVLFGTPNNGVDLARLVKFLNKQLGDLAEGSDFIDDLRNEWINNVYSPSIKDGDRSFKLHIPVTPVLGLEDKIVDDKSAKSFFRDPAPETVLGNHTSMKEPSNRNELSYLIVSNVIKRWGYEKDSPTSRETSERSGETHQNELAVERMFFKFLDPYPILYIALWQNGTTDVMLSSVEIEIMDFEKKSVPSSSQVRFTRTLPPSNAWQFQLATALSEGSKVLHYSLQARAMIPVGHPLEIDMLLFDQIGDGRKVSPIALGRYQIQIAFITEDRRRLLSAPLCLINETTHLIPCSGLPARQRWTQWSDWTYPGYNAQLKIHASEIKSWKEISAENIP